MLIQLSSQYLFPLLFFAGLTAGTVDAIAGGGGLIALPVLLGVGLPPHLALGTNKLQSLCGTAVGVYTYHQHGWLNREGLLPGLLYSFIGAALGAIAIQVIDSHIVKKIIPILLFLVLIYIIFSPTFGRNEVKPKMQQNIFYVVFGTLLGFYDGFLGPGVGFFWVFLLVVLLGFNLMKATAYTKVFNLNTNITATVCFALGHHIDYRIAFCMAVGQIIGGRIGAYLAVKKGVALIRPVFIGVVTATIFTLVYRSYIGVFTKSSFVTISLAVVIAIYGWRKWHQRSRL